MKDYYAILEVDPTATPEEIKAQYRLLIQAWHPDKFGSLQLKAKAEVKAIEINEAYRILSQPAKRAEYDRLRHRPDSGPEVSAEATQERPPSPPPHTPSQASSQAPVRAERLVLPGGVVIELVRVPAGEFLMGSADYDNDAWSHCKPPHQVTLGEYLIGRYPVTNVQYAAYAAARRRGWSMPVGKGSHPVVNVNWGDAAAFCQWASQVAGRTVQLPTEAQWEKAARGTDGRHYPWGNEPPNASRLNYDSRPRLAGGAISSTRTTPVGQYSPQGDSVYGAADMLGNVDEWTGSAYRRYPYAEGDPLAEASQVRIIRGGNFNSRVGFFGCARRGSQAVDSKSDYLGFRVVVSPT